MKKLQNPVDEGWSVHIYDRQRRLLCALESSHIWTFLLGCTFGLLLAVVWGNLAQPSSRSTSLGSSSTASPIFQVD